MGTRNITAVYSGGKYVVAKYCQWDGYPEGQGQTALEWLRQAGNVERLRAGVKNVRKITKKQINAAWQEAGVKPRARFVSFGVSDKMKELHPELHRDTGAGILEIVAASTDKLSLENEIEFVADGLFCEWVWLVDLDANTFESFKGGSDQPLTGNDRFHCLKGTGTLAPSSRVYYPAKLVAKWPLDELPDDEAFLAAFAKPEEESEEAEATHDAA